MKLTAKNFELIVSQLSTAHYEAKDCEFGGSPELRLKIKELKAAKELFAKVNLSFSVGQRSFAQECFKIGKSYYEVGGYKMTKGLGYCIHGEIDVITDEMKEEMITDSYYF